MTTRTEPKAMREIHEIRERLHEEQKDWTDAERRAYYDRVGGEIAKKLGLRTVPQPPRKLLRKAS
jgi:hypothetical protein